MSPDSNSSDLTLWIECACQLEASARKPGNVHPERGFEDLTYFDFLEAARWASPILAQSRSLGIGPAIEQACTGQGEDSTVTGTPSRKNVNLGICLLIAPLAAVDRSRSLREGIGEILSRLTVADAIPVYRAIRTIQAGGMKQVEQQDVSDTPSISLLDAMRLAEERDTIAREYARGYPITLDWGLSVVREWGDWPENWESRIIELALMLQARVPDSLIARKNGEKLACEASQMAREVLEAGGPASESRRTKMAQFDTWLRADGNKRNPGTTADFIAAILFAAFREGILKAFAPDSITRMSD